jgi:hypothetical protein
MGTATWASISWLPARVPHRRTRMLPVTPMYFDVPQASFDMYSRPWHRRAELQVEREMKQPRSASSTDTASLHMPGKTPRCRTPFHIGEGLVRTLCSEQILSSDSERGSLLLSSSFRSPKCQDQACSEPWYREAQHNTRHPIFPMTSSKIKKIQKLKIFFCVFVITTFQIVWKNALLSHSALASEFYLNEHREHIQNPFVHLETSGKNWNISIMLLSGILSQQAYWVEIFLRNMKFKIYLKLECDCFYQTNWEKDVSPLCSLELAEDELHKLLIRSPLVRRSPSHPGPDPVERGAAAAHRP